MDIASMQRDENNFDFLRFFAASAVVLGHCYWLSGLGAVEPVRLFTGSMDTADIAVNLFFVMSGFLIAASWIHSRSSVDFAGKRALRIFPALAVSTLFTAFIVGPLATDLPLSEYLLNSQTVRYLTNVALFTQFHLPGVFTANPFPGTVNGSVWTLPYEVLMYTMLLTLGLLKLFGRIAVLVVPIALMFIHFHLAPNLGLESDMLRKVTRLGMFFFLGSALYLYRKILPWNWKIALALLSLSLISARTEWWFLVHVLTLPYLTIYLAHLKIPRLSRFGRYGDFSYGIYIFSFPVQQLLVHWLDPELPLPVFMAISLTASIAIAALSWHLIESPALRLKRFLPGSRQGVSGAGLTPAP
ncbi:acyltransferase family protein [Stutzerimonas xanthomarina]|uniref:Peptidoglycan/LPS O-acetylase OafA/YrhL, contains acyltransferase and SGNH-hydrolase domains n=2 Tax=Stutzerimonas xanthomarina TaxID=271420 RepID=A0A1M5RKA0_9GAMM|nr:acyltransferase [Stutzerimonas xanthomarina]MCP9339180.1 acyltransferase [Stutzerimonas xanthomarina]SEH95966.1 Peptidoglycan/LPS O-acetylase OafA/YrhL, contains acyltransferase and SGNH-hydrolase domains [Stutzerimonas xanthomarina]SHH26675.1 Peptidoglycan/LPS O-acetylase OafA/YrhL, contains acyltransferase and SGNH-hydrolase domains [Stutzerimonas xanthomarina DSM 18231]